MNTRNMFKANSKDTRTTKMAPGFTPTQKNIQQLCLRIAILKKHFHVTLLPRHLLNETKNISRRNQFQIPFFGYMRPPPPTPRKKVFTIINVPFIISYLLPHFKKKKKKKPHDEFIKECISEAVTQRCSVKQVFLELLQNSKENTCARVSF